MHVMPDGTKMPGKLSDMKGYSKLVKSRLSKKGKMDGKGGPNDLSSVRDSLRNLNRAQDGTGVSPTRPLFKGPVAPTPAPGLPGGPDPAQMGIGNQNPFRPGAAETHLTRSVKGLSEYFAKRIPRDRVIKDIMSSPGKLHDILGVPLKGVNKPDNLRSSSK